MTKKCVDCKKCRFYLIDQRLTYPPNKYTGTDAHTFCMHPKNAKKTAGKTLVFISSPSLINKDRNCNWFEPTKPIHTLVWNHDDTINYKDHGDGTYNINPAGGSAGFYIGEKSLKNLIDNANTDISESVRVMQTKVEDHLGQIIVIKEDVERIKNKIEQKIENYNQAIERNTEIVNNMKESVDALSRSNVQDGHTTIDGGDSQTIFS